MAFVEHGSTVAFTFTALNCKYKICWLGIKATDCCCKIAASAQPAHPSHAALTALLCPVWHCSSWVQGSKWLCDQRGREPRLNWVTVPTDRQYVCTDTRDIPKMGFPLTEKTKIYKPTENHSGELLYLPWHTDHAGNVSVDVMGIK